MRERLERYLGYHIASIVAMIRLLINMPLIHVTLEVEGQVRTYHTPLVFIGVGERELKLPTLGSRVPGGESGLHVMVIRRKSGARALAMALAAVARGVESVAKTPALDAFIVERCTIETRASTIAVDGELVRTAGPFEYKHLPGCLKVIVPGPASVEGQ
jgi:diacylglycerol kinase family enzyme